MRRLLVVVLIALGVAAPAVAQQAVSELRGRVLDQQRAVLPGVTIVVRNQDSGLIRETVSNVDGTYFLPALTPAVYEITAQLPGFRRYARPNVQLAVGQTTTIDITLELGALEETVTVSAQSPLVDLTSYEVGGYIQNAELLETPSINRNFTGYLGLLPGVVASGSAASFAADSISVNGQSSANVTYQLDGGSNNDDNLAGSAGAQARIPIEAVQEFQLLTGQFDAQYGQSSGGVLNAVSKAGTNQFRGSVFGFFKDAAYTAKDYFVRTQNLEKPQTKEQQWGGTIGGPIVQNAAHFFYSLEVPVLDKGVTVNIPARPDLNFACVEEVRPWNHFIRGDHQLNSNHTYGARFLFETSPSTHCATTWAEGTQEFERDIDWAFVGSYNAVFGNNRVNELRISGVYEDLHWESSEEAFGGGRPQAQQPPRLNYNTWTGGVIDTSFQRINLTWGIDDTYSWFVPDKAGDHDFKFGGQYQYVTIDYIETNDRNGTFTFNTDLNFDPANPFTYPERLTIQVGDRNYYQFAHMIGAFMQDKWRLNDRTTLSVGVRYDLEISPTPNDLNPFYTASSAYPVDKNNLSPRVGFSHVLDGSASTVLRGGYGRFFQRTRLTNTNELFGTGAPYTSWFNVTLPIDGIDPGPSRGQLPTHPLLANGPSIDRTLLAQFYPPGTVQLNAGTIRFDNADRTTPYVDQFSIGVQRQLREDMAVSLDYIRSQQRDLLLEFNRNQPVRSSTARSGRLVRPSTLYLSNVYQVLSEGWGDYDGLQFQFDKRFSDDYRFRVSYTYARSNGIVSFGNRDTVFTQEEDKLNLERMEGPSGNHRPHNLAINGTWAIPGTGGVRLSGVLRAMSGVPFTLTSSRLDTNRNGSFADEYLPAGTYSGAGVDGYTVDFNGRNGGARGPNIIQLDLRGAYRVNRGGARSLEAYVDVINVTNRANFNPPSGDQRLSSFMILNSLWGDGIPRQAQFGVRFAF